METKRVTLYLNLEDDRDLEIWNFIKDQKKKPAYIKSILYGISKNLDVNNKNKEENVIDPGATPGPIKEDIELTESDILDVEGF